MKNNSFFERRLVFNDFAFPPVVARKEDAEEAKKKTNDLIINQKQELRLLRGDIQEIASKNQEIASKNQEISQQQKNLANQKTFKDMPKIPEKIKDRFKNKLLELYKLSNSTYEEFNKKNSEEKNKLTASLKDLIISNEDKKYTGAIKISSILSGTDLDWRGGKILEIYLTVLYSSLEKRNNYVVVNNEDELQSAIKNIDQNHESGLILGKGFKKANISLNFNKQVLDSSGLPIKGADGRYVMEKRSYNPPLIIEADNNVTIGSLKLANVKGLKLQNMTLEKDSKDFSKPNLLGKREDRLLTMREIEDVDVAGITFKGEPLDLKVLESGTQEGAQKFIGAIHGILVQKGKNINISGNSFSDLYTAIDIKDFEGGTISDNKSDMIIEDIVTGGGYRNVEITNNHSKLRIPVIFGKNKEGHDIKNHSDFVQLHTNNGGNELLDMRNQNVTISGNIEADFSKDQRYRDLITTNAKNVIVGVQGIIIGDEMGVRAGNPAKNKQIHILNNRLFNNQYNAITVQAIGGTLTGNIITKLKNPNPKEKSDPRITLLKGARGFRISENKIDNNIIFQGTRDRKMMIDVHKGAKDFSTIGKNTLFQELQKEGLTSQKGKKLSYYWADKLCGGNNKVKEISVTTDEITYRTPNGLPLIIRKDSIELHAELIGKVFGHFTVEELNTLQKNINDNNLDDIKKFYEGKENSPNNWKPYFNFSISGGKLHFHHRGEDGIIVYETIEVKQDKAILVMMPERK